MYAHMPDYELVAMVEEIEADRVKKTNELHMEFEKAEFEDNTAECDSVEAEINRLWEAAKEKTAEIDAELYARVSVATAVTQG
jgi:hypothetical protein